MFALFGFDSYNANMEQKVRDYTSLAFFIAYFDALVLWHGSEPCAYARKEEENVRF